jgi:hypothetical protein
MFRNFEENLYGKVESSDADLILYYFKSSVDQFIHGDFESSFLHAYKIIFDKAFDRLHKIEAVNAKRKPFKHIRNALAHAKVIGDVKELRKLKKQLYTRNLEILKIVKFEFMDALCRKPSITKKN